MKPYTFCWLLGLGATALQSCAPVGLRDEAAKEPVRWILVERRYGDVANPISGDGTVNPDATILAFQPLYREDLEWEAVVSPAEHFVELLQVSPQAAVTPGEVVTARVRVGNATPDQHYRLTASPSEQGVRILGPTTITVVGSASALFRFTSSKPGRSGIAVMVNSIGGCRGPAG